MAPPHPTTPHHKPCHGRHSFSRCAPLKYSSSSALVAVTDVLGGSGRRCVLKGLT